MRVSIDHCEEQRIESTLEMINKWWISVTSNIYQEERLIYSIDIDDHTVYNGYEDTIINNYNSIRTININTKTKSDSYDETKILLDDYIVRFIPSAERISEHFYGEILQEHWDTILQLFKGLEWIVTSLKFMEVISSNDPFVSQILAELTDKISGLEISLNEEDYIMCGDILLYEIIPILNRYQTRLSN